MPTDLRYVPLEMSIQTKDRLYACTNGDVCEESRVLDGVGFGERHKTEFLRQIRSRQFAKTW